MKHTLAPYYLLTACLLAIQLCLLVWLPVVADEAYFVSWGDFFSLGYYDHPPMTGWVASLFHGVVGRAYWLRGLSWLLGVGLFILLYHTVKTIVADRKQAFLISLLWLALPANLLAFSQYLNDSLMYFFAMGFVASIYYSWRSFGKANRHSWWWAALAGVCLGAALLSKYLVALYVLALLLVLFLRLRDSLAFMCSRLLLAGVIAAALFSINLYWNYQNCLINLAFNFYYREPGVFYRGLVEFFVSLLAITGPWLFFRFAGKAFFSQSLRIGSELFFQPLFAAAVWVTALVAMLKGHFGLHWGLPLSFLAVLAYAEGQHVDTMGKALRWHLGYVASVVMLLMLAVGLVVTGTGMSERKQQKLLTAWEFSRDLDNGSLAARLRESFPGYYFASSSYGLTAMLNNHDIPAVLLFNDSKYGRNHDIFIDYPQFDGGDFLLFSSEQKPDLKPYQAFFSSVELVHLAGLHRDYTVIRARRFHYQQYHRVFILPLLEKFYAHPLPQGAACYMQKYQMN